MINALIREEEEEEEEELQEQEEREATYNERNHEEENDNESTTIIARASSTVASMSVPADSAADKQKQKQKDPQASDPDRSDLAPVPFHVDVMSSTAASGVVEDIRAPDHPSSNRHSSDAAGLRLKESIRATRRQSGAGAFHVIPNEPERHGSEDEQESEEDDEERGISNHILYEGISDSETTNEDTDPIYVLATPVFDQDSQGRGSDTEISIVTNYADLIHAIPLKNNEKMSTRSKIGMAVLIFISIIVAIVLSTTRRRPIPTVDNGFTSSPTPSPTVNSDELQSYLEAFSSVADLERIGSPQHNALLWLANRDQHDIEFADVMMHQRYALIVLYYATKPNIASFMDIWVDETKHECDWGAVISCITDTAGMRHLTNIDLSKKRLEGTLPTEIGLLQDLYDLRISENEVRGTIPEEIVNLTVLTSLDLSKNKLSGSIPDIIGSIEGLEHIALFENKLTGQLPDEIFNLRALKTLNLSTNQLSGTLSSLLANLAFLTILKLMDNNFSGMVPDVFSSLPDLNIFALDYNDFHGTLPDVSIAIARLEEVTVSHNRISGKLEFPEEFDGINIVNLRLKKLDMSHNLFSGSLPSLLGYMPTLKYMDISDNIITGTLTSHFHYMDQLQDFRASDNLLTGQVPQLPRNMKHIDLKGNALTGGFFDSWFFDLQDLEIVCMGGSHPGPIPSEIGNLSSLRYFDASDCDLSGTLPLTFGNLPHLSQLLLEGNNITGPIPSEFGKLELMSELNLDDNALTSTIPAALKSMHNLQVLSLENNTLSGSIPIEISKLNNLVELQLAGNTLEGSIPEEVCALGLEQLQVDSSMQCSCC